MIHLSTPQKERTCTSFLACELLSQGRYNTFLGMCQQVLQVLAINAWSTRLY